MSPAQLKPVRRANQQAPSVPARAPSSRRPFETVRASIRTEQAESHVLGVAMRVRLRAMGLGRVMLLRVHFTCSSGIHSGQVRANNVKRYFLPRGGQT
jgi:hypothetical protein